MESKMVVELRRPGVLLAEPRLCLFWQDLIKERVKAHLSQQPKAFQSICITAGLQPRLRWLFGGLLRETEIENCRRVDGVSLSIVAFRGHLILP